MKRIVVLLLVIMLAIGLVGCDDIGSFIDQTEIGSIIENVLGDIIDDGLGDATESPTKPHNNATNTSFDYADIPAYSGEAFYVVNGGAPYFGDDERANADAFETYSSLDNLGRCGVAYANVCLELMPTEDRESISHVYPSGWKYNGKSNNNEYDTSLVDGGRIY